MGIRRQFMGMNDGSEMSGMSFDAFRVGLEQCYEIQLPDDVWVALFAAFDP